MLQFFRNFFDSKVGIGVTLALVGLIALAFAGGDIAGNGGFGAFSSGSKIATVGSDKVTATQMSAEVNRLLERLRKDNPRLTIKEFLAKDGLNEVIDYVIDNKATLLWGEDNGLHIGDRLIDSELAKDSRIQAPDGKVDTQLYNQMLQQAGISDSEFRAQVAQQLMARQLLGSTTLGLKVPRKVVLRYAGVITEQRKGAIAVLPPAAFAPAAMPSDGEVQAWYDSHKGNYALPERRSIRYLTYTDAVIAAVPAPTEAEVSARYTLNKAKYAPTDKRKLSQVVFLTEAIARQVQAEIAAGKTLETAARAKGLAVATLGSLTSQAYAGQTSGAAASTVFGAETGKVVGPVKVPLGWALVRIEGRETTPGKSIDQARAEILKALGEEKRRSAIVEFSARIEDELSNGASIADIAKELGLQVQETPLLTADGHVFGQAGAEAPAVLARIVPTAFQSDGPGQAQLAEVETGKTFVIFDAGKVLPASPPPLAEIRAQVAEDARIAKGEKAAEAAARKLKAQLEKGIAIDAAVASLGVALPPVDHVDMNRQQIQNMGQKAPRPLLILFLTAKGKVTLMRGPRNHGWYVVTVSDVVAGKIAENDPRLAGLSGTLEQNQSEEIGDAMRAAFRADVGTNRNDANITKLRQQLGGSN